MHPYVEASFILLIIGSFILNFNLISRIFQFREELKIKAEYVTGLLLMGNLQDATTLYYKYKNLSFIFYQSGYFDKVIAKELKRLKPIIDPKYHKQIKLFVVEINISI